MSATAAEQFELDRLLSDADHSQWPVNTDEAAWEALHNWCFQEECRDADEAEAEMWLTSVRALSSWRLPHAQFVIERGAILRERERVRKLLQSRLRWKYGHKAGRRPGPVRRDVRRFHADWSGN